MIYVDRGRCTGCGVCVDACPTGAIQLVESVASINQDLCQECEACLETCPQAAILAVSEPVPVRVRDVPAPVPESALVQRAPGGVWPWLGGVLAFVGVEVLPRVAASLLEAWDRRGAIAPTASANVSPERTVPPTSSGSGGGRQHRRRRRGGRT